ncbi:MULTISPECIES: MBL fold metallo-hydrolase [Flavobacteriaceae]|uniref:MBL fold metallo-hydrolase n=1 Tax=Flavobacteriaceae TaxID=49546 RepID=UPI00234AE32B|nr:MBL fold metallo-hydrolase [Muricauda sp. SP22]MDC6361502.1 MBL fold metallo-hydrolase [Muricauda sp. SP22]
MLSLIFTFGNMKIYNFKVQKTMDGNLMEFHPTVINVNNKNYLVDCGYAETYEAFTKGLSKLGIGVHDLHAIIISHDDIDHLGALKRFKEENLDLIIYCSQVEEPSVSGKVKSERLLQAEANLPHMDEAFKPWAQKFIVQLQGIERVPVDIALKDGDHIADGLHVIATPGHTRGHVSFHIPDQKTLIANDALVIEEGEFNIANPQFTLDLEEAVRSVEKIKTLGAEKIICYHGGVMEEGVDKKLTALIHKYRSNLNHS